MHGGLSVLFIGTFFCVASEDFFLQYFIVKFRIYFILFVFFNIYFSESFLLMKLRNAPKSVSKPVKC